MEDFSSFIFKPTIRSFSIKQLLVTIPSGFNVFAPSSCHGIKSCEIASAFSARGCFEGLTWLHCFENMAPSGGDLIDIPRKETFKALAHPLFKQAKQSKRKALNENIMRTRGDEQEIYEFPGKN